jgi:TRAP-type C4-dicarboxylate transport system substrate-binding protein
MRKSVLTLVLALTLVSLVMFAGAEAKEYNWKMISGETEGMAATIFCEEYAKAVETMSEGRIKIEVFPYGAFGGTRDILELIQMGQVELCAIDSSWLASFVPQMSVFNLQYLWPKHDDIDQIVHYVMKNGESVDLLKEACRARNFELLGIYASGWMYMSSNVPIRSPEDVKNLKHRVWGNPILVQAYNGLGFNAQSLNWTEVYGALQTGVLDSQYQAMPGHWGYALYEVQKYLTNMWNELFIMSPTMNYAAFNGLPQDLQKVLIDAFLETIEPGSSFMNWLANDIRGAEENIKEKKPTITVYEFNNEEVMPFKRLAEQDVNTYNVYLKTSGKGAEQIYDALKSDMEEAFSVFSQQ